MLTGLGFWAFGQVFCLFQMEIRPMSTLAPAQYISDLCEKYDAYEYSIYILVTFPDGKRIITQSAELANAMQVNGAETVHITELGE